MNIRHIAMGIIILALASCKKEIDEEQFVPFVVQASDYTKLEVGNYWVYERFYVNYETGEEQINSTLDSIYIASDTIIDGLEYKRFGGSWFGLNFNRMVRNEGPNLVSFDGKTFMSTAVENDTIDINTSVSTNTIDSIYTIIKSEDIVVEIASEFYESEHQYERIFFMNPDFLPPSLSPRRDTEYYVKDIGVAKYTSYIASGPVNIEMRLIRYSVD